jgi:acyl carrier protein
MENIKAEVRKFLSRYLRNQTISDEDDIFKKAHVSSLVAMELVLFVEKSFAVKVAKEDLKIDNFRSVDAIAALIARKRPLGT